jgi:hypothetical protein
VTNPALPLQPTVFAPGELTHADEWYQRVWKPVSDTIITEAGDLAWHYVGQPGEPAFLNGWANYNTPANAAAGFRLRHGRVWLQGLVGGGTPANSSTGTGVVFVLPEAYRPAFHGIFVCGARSGAGRVDVYPTGEVVIVDGVIVGADPATYCSLSSVRFVPGA